VFPSATAAALAVMSMQEELRLSQSGKGEDRLAMRDHPDGRRRAAQDGGLFGDAVVLATRIATLHREYPNGHA
jgi:hypothetical protein